MKHVLCCLALLFLFFAATAQSSPSSTNGNNSRVTSNGLAIGDTVPDLVITDIINHPDGIINLSELRGKLIILDFWATWCSPCIASFPKMDSLRKTLQGKVEILPVTYQPREEVDRLFKKAAILKGITMPIAVNDKQLHALFPHNNLPHYVWISPQGKVTAITHSEEVSYSNIMKMLAQPSQTLTEKKDRKKLPYDRNLPLLFNSVEISAEDIHYQSLTLPYKEGYSSRIDILYHPDHSIARLTATNIDLPGLYAMAYSSESDVLYGNRIILRDGAQTIRPPAQEELTREQHREWIRRNGWCYELNVPNSISKNFLPMMREDLQRIFPQYKASLEKQPTKILALVRTSKQDKIKTSAGRPDNTLDHFEATITNGTLALLLSHWNGTSLQHLSTPVIDMTGYKGKMDISLKCGQSDIEALRKELQKYDLDLVSKTADVPMLVISYNR